ncbi:S49 family peptidase [Alteromonas macleodii]|uniref:Clp protease family protein n=1 Tax=Alteromonas macleodii TaxID=28108 RepID=A0AB36FQZ2_ALTMA|nr:S49 family peptidase [Alteromonas macleodii]OES23924.1 clp protease family protein [Alteromonas macleodii]OES24102.1 clp protease family protein [Alteromonas macleodii]OES25029.1 clp protease family protein [Alteromonas macleodii]OES38703.1 clp protease family protein [Alteromonas macleodii]
MGNEHQQTPQSEQDGVMAKLVDTLAASTEALNKSSEALVGVTRMSRADERLRKFKIGMIFLPLTLILLFYFFQSYKSGRPFGSEPYVALVEINGEIATNALASAKNVNVSLQKAFADTKSQGVFISIDSPGGSPAESARIHDEIIALKAQYPDKKVIVFGNGSLTSGAYWIACAADEIHTLSMTMVGSIGVKMESYDLSEIAKKYDVSKLVFTAGEHKHRLDPLIEPTAEDIEKFNSMLAKLHTLFKDTVTASRSDKIDESRDPTLFSGDFWIGVEAVEMGLVDSVTTPNVLLKETFGTVHMLDYTQHPNVLDTLNKQRVLGGWESLLDYRIR